MAKSKSKKISAWAWAVSGLLVGVAGAWIVVEYTVAISQPTNGGQPVVVQQQNQVAAQQEQTQVQQQASQQEIANLKAQNQQAQATVGQQQAELIKQQEISQLFSIGNTLQDYYNKIRTAQNLGSASCPYSSQCEVNFWAMLASGVNSGTSYESTYNSLTGQQNSGTYSDAATAAEKQLETLVFAPYAAGVISTDSDAVKIKKILDFIDANLTYERDMQETPRAPAETLGLKSGDCKSYSILASAAFSVAGVHSAVMRVENASGTVGHAMVLVQSNENLPLSEYYSDLTSFGLPAGKWWVIEPQYAYEEQQQHPDWFAQWKVIHAAQVALRT
jgi:hypothetical protein